MGVIYHARKAPDSSLLDGVSCPGRNFLRGGCDLASIKQVEASDEFVVDAFVDVVAHHGERFAMIRVVVDQMLEPGFSRSVCPHCCEDEQCMTGQKRQPLLDEHLETRVTLSVGDADDYCPATLTVCQVGLGVGKTIEDRRSSSFGDRGYLCF